MMFLSSFPSSASLHPSPYSTYLGIALGWFIGECNFPSHCPQDNAERGCLSEVWIDDSRWHFKIPSSSVSLRNKCVLLPSPASLTTSSSPAKHTFNSLQLAKTCYEIWIVVQSQKSVNESGVDWIEVSDSVISLCSLIRQWKHWPRILIAQWHVSTGGSNSHLGPTETPCGRVGLPQAHQSWWFIPPLTPFLK